ncbi:MAG: YqeG family HAD IIIA-type phosphatase [Bacillota bacterium]|nr:YqeG family HAD IIIA-type phosphatase [Bacillota bacterium]
MNKKLVPDIRVDSIDDLSGSFFVERGIKAVFLDIDNTLVAPHIKVPDERVQRFIKSLTDYGIIVCYISNNNKKRVSAFNTHNFYYIHRAGKPFTFAYRAALKKFGVSKNEAAAVGDQFFSDIYGANRAGLLTVMVKPIEIGHEGPFVWLKRKFEKHVLKELEKVENTNIK